MELGLRRWRPMVPYFGAFLGLGVALSFFGPALPALRAQTDSTVGEIGLVFSAQSFGGLIGSVVAGRLYRRVGGRHLIALALVAFAGAIAFVPVPSELVVLVALGGVIGLGAGTIDVGGNTMMSSVVDPDALLSSLNALHLSFAVGALLGPLIVGLSQATTDALWPACAVFAVGTLALGGVMWSGDREGSARQAAHDHAEQAQPPARWRLAIVAFFFLLYVGLEIGFAGFLATYSDELHLGADWPTVLTAGFWAGFLIGRLFMVWRGDGLDTGRVLWVSVIGATVLAPAVAFVGARPVPLLAVSVLFGAVIAPQFPTMLAHLHRAVPLTGVVTAWCIAGSALGGLILPPTIGALVDTVGAAALPWTVAAASAASAGVLFVIDRWALVLPPSQIAPVAATAPV